jgi:hypothetical protein
VNIRIKLDGGLIGINQTWLLRLHPKILPYRKT